MTISELYVSVAQLGFEDSLEDDQRFFYAANRALLQVNAIRPAIRSYIINHKPMRNRVKEETFMPVEKADELCFEASGVRAYYFEADGNGQAYIEKYDGASWSIIGKVKLSASEGFVPYRGFIRDGSDIVDGEVRLRFTGPYLYSVKNVAMYANILSDRIEDIPAYEQFTRYDMSRLCSDFLSLSSPPIRADREYTCLNQGYDVENGRVILLPYDAGGLYKIIYHHKPTLLKGDNAPKDDGTVIDLDEELCALLPILIAAYVWADDEPEKAQYYLALYRERAVDIERRLRDNTPVFIKSTNGW